MSDERELEALRRVYRDDVMTASSEACPAKELLVRLAMGELEGDERAAVSDHVVGCRSCAEDFRLASALHEEARTDLISRRRSVARISAFAAAAVLALSVGVYFFSSSRPATDVLRGPLGETTSPAQGETLRAAPATLSWPSQAGATGYVVRLYGFDGSLLWQSARTEQRSMALPPEARDLAAQSYYWLVSVEGPVQGAELGPFTFTIE